MLLTRRGHLSATAALDAAAEAPCSGASCPSLNPQPRTAEEALAQKYLPVVYVRQQAGPCDRSGEAFEPVPVEVVLGNPSVTLRRRSDPGYLKVAPTAADLFQEGPDAYLDFPGDPLSPGCRYEKDIRRFQEGKPNVTYAHVIGEKGVPELALQYWFFFYFNDWTNKHEGDWEMIQIDFAAATPADALEQEPLRVDYSQHRGGEVRAWTDRKLQKEGTRPVVYLAVGSHASHYGQHVYIGRPGSRAGFGCEDASGPGKRIDLQVKVVPTVPSGPDDPYAWVAFPGRWGEPAGTAFDGPTGPIIKWQWWQPFSWEHARRQSSVRAPSPATIGPDAVNVFCQAVALGSDLLFPTILKLPLITGIVFGAFCLGAVSSLTRTRFLPVQAYPLRCRRRLGQILTTALDLYRRRAHVFLGLGLLSLPMAFAVAAVHWRIGFTPLTLPISLPGAGLASRAALLLGLGELELGVTYAIVVSVTTAYVARLEAGKGGLLRALKDTWGCLPDLLFARLSAVLVVGALAFTIVGIPLALRQAVRWTLVEQAVLLDGRTGRDAMRESSDLVVSAWWWSAASILALGLAALTVAPIVGVLLIVAAGQVPLHYINLVSAVVNACLVPYIAIALALTYYDLKSRQPSRS